MKETRRGIIKYLAGTLVGVGNVGVVNGITPDRNKSCANQPYGCNMVTSRTDETDMFLALPGCSLSSLIMNIPQLMNAETPTPVIVDKYDLERLRGRIATQKSGYQAQRLGLMYNEMYHRGLIRPFDYQKYYPHDIQQENIKQTQRILSSMSDHENREIAHSSATGYIHYGVGEYQESLRRSLNNMDRYLDTRNKVQREKARIERGTRDPRKWNEKVVSQYLAALGVRRNLERELDRDIQAIGQHETEAIQSVFDKRNYSDLPPTLQHITEQPSDLFSEFDVEDTLKRRNIADQISQIAQDVVGIDNDHWYVFGSRLALTQSGDVYKRTRSHLRFNSVDSVATEAQSLLSKLRERRNDNRSIEHLTAEAEWLMEENDLNHIDRRRLLDQLRTETKLTNYSRDLDEVSVGYSPAAKVIVESILTDPVNRYTKDDVYREAIDLMRMLEPVQLTDEQLDSFYSRGSYRVGIDKTNWYQDPNRQPVTS